MRTSESGSHMGARTRSRHDVPRPGDTPPQLPSQNQAEGVRGSLADRQGRRRERAGSSQRRHRLPQVSLRLLASCSPEARQGVSDPEVPCGGKARRARGWISLEEESLLQGKEGALADLLNVLWWTCPIMVPRERSGGAGPRRSEAGRMIRACSWGGRGRPKAWLLGFTHSLGHRFLRRGCSWVTGRARRPPACYPRFGMWVPESRLKVAAGICALTQSSRASRGGVMAKSLLACN